MIFSVLEQKCSKRQVDIPLTKGVSVVDPSTSHTGNNYHVESGKAIFFGSEVNRNVMHGEWHMKGFPARDALAALFTSMYVPLDIKTMRDVQAEISETMLQDRKAGNLDKLSMVVLYKTSALFLFIQGVLKVEHFNEAVETADYIDVPNVKIGRRKVTVRILSGVPEYDVMTADANGVMI